jgi:hypothetical protein
MKVVYSLKQNTFIVMFIIACRGCLKKTAHAITLLLMTQMKKIIQETKWLQNATNLSEHIISIPFTYLWAMGNFYFSNGNL